MIRAVLGAEAYDLGYALGSIVGALILAFLIMFAWGAFRADEDRATAGWAAARQWRTASLAGFLWLAGTIGRL